MVGVTRLMIGLIIPLHFLRAVFTECRETKTKVITLTNRKGRNAIHRPIKTGDNYTKRAKTCANKSRLVLVLLLIGWVSGASFLNQSLSVVMQSQSKRKLLSTLKWKQLYPILRKNQNQSQRGTRSKNPEWLKMRCWWLGACKYPFMEGVHSIVYLFSGGHIKSSKVQLNLSLRPSSHKGALICSTKGVPPENWPYIYSDTCPCLPLPSSFAHHKTNRGVCGRDLVPTQIGPGSFASRTRCRLQAPQFAPCSS